MQRGLEALFLYRDDRYSASPKLTMLDLAYCVRLGKEPLTTK
jgi:hypothetical protein